jgi:lysophospholipase L1-like esterase
MKSLGKFCLALGSLLVALLLAEGLLRLLVAPGVPTAANDRGFFARFDPELGWAPRSSVSGLHRDKGFSVLVSQNRFGLRAPDDLETGRRGAARRMLVLGDSYVWGYGVPQEQLFSDPHVHQSEVEIVNFGVSGYGTDQALLLYRRLGTRFEVDEVVLAFTPYNDVENNLASRQYDREKPYFTVENGGLRLHDAHVVDWVWRTRADKIRVSSRILNLIDSAALQIRNRVLRATAEPEGVAEARDEARRAAEVTSRDRDGVELTRILIRTLAEEVRARGADFSVVFVPYKPHVLADLPENHPLVPLLAAALTTDGIPYHEPYPFFLAGASAGRSLFNPLDNHLSPDGHREFARHLVDPALRVQTRDYYALPAVERP